MNQSHIISNTSSVASNDIIVQSYYEYHAYLVNYIHRRIENREDANDMAQDTFVKLIDYKQMLRPETVKSFIFTIARNLVIDYIRRQYRKQEVSANMYEFSREFQETSESQMYADDILRLENGMLMTLPKQRKLIYTMDRFEDKSADEIAAELKISKRTVESHLFSSRKAVREFLRQCI